MAMPNPRQALRTYSKRVLQDSYNPPSKRQRIKAPESLENTPKYTAAATTPTVPKKRSISDYLSPATHTSSPSTPQSSIFSSDPPEKDTKSPLSSPPPLGISPSALLQKKRPRRLTTRPALGVMSDSEMNAARERRSKRVKKEFRPGSPRPVKYLGEDSEPGLRKAADGGTISEEDVSSDSSADEVLGGIDMPDPRISVGPLITEPFAPGRRWKTGLLPALRTATSGLVGSKASNSPGRVDIYDPQATFGRVKIPDGTNTAIADNGSPPRHRSHSLIAAGVAAMRAANAAQSNIQNTGDSSQPATSESKAKAAQSNVQSTGDSIQLEANISEATVPQSSVQAIAGQASVHGSRVLVQTQLYLGQETTTTCTLCHFTYNNTRVDDIRIHQEHHKTYFFGIPINGSAEQHVTKLWSKYDYDNGQEHYIAVVDRQSHRSWKELATTVLVDVDRDLGSMGTNSDRLWSLMPNPLNTAIERQHSQEVDQVPRFKVYLYVKGRHRGQPSRVVSLLLAERVAEGLESNLAQIVADEFGDWPSEVPNTKVELSNKSHEAVLGVNKIWTHRSHRRCRYATCLLREARSHFVWGRIIVRSHVAWTWTTNDGTKFAERYHANDSDEYSFLTYLEGI